MSGFGSVGRFVGATPDRVEWWKLGRQPVGTKLVQMLGLEQVLQAVLTEIDHIDLPWQPPPRRLRDQILAAVAGGHHPGCAMDIQTGVVAPDELRVPRVDADTHADRQVLRPALCSKRPLRVDGGSNRILRGRKHNEKAVARRAHLDASMALEHVSQAALVGLEQPGPRWPGAL
jgi:hypothetical protein